jgi:hypothetical protein
MGSSTTNGDVPVDAQARAREGVEHLQTAARELIEAARAALDVAEDLVNDPESLASLAGSLAAVGEVARRVTGAGEWPPTAARTGGHRPPPRDADTEGTPRVERIRVS